MVSKLEIILSKPIYIDEDTSWSEAKKIMKENKTNYLLIFSKGKLAGIITEKELLYFHPSPATSLSKWELNYLLDKLKVSEIMKKTL